MSPEISTLMHGNGANDATQPYSIDSGYFSSLIYVAVYPPPSSSPQAVEDGGGGSKLYITDEAFVHLSCGWVTEGRERGTERKDARGCRGGCKERGKITKRNEDRGRERKRGEGRKGGQRD